MQSMSEMIEEDTGLIENNIGMTNDSIGMIEEDTGLINQDTGLISETADTENTKSKRKKRSRERGKDAKPRNFPLHTMKNLSQFRNKPHEEVRQYMLEKKGVDIGSNFNFGSMVLWISALLTIVVGGIGIWKIYKFCQKQQYSENEIS